MADESYIPLLHDRRACLHLRLRLESWEGRLSALERQFRVHLVPYVVAEVSDKPPPVHLCRLYKKAMYSRRLARALEALQRNANGNVVIVAYRKPWQRESDRACQRLPPRAHKCRVSSGSFHQLLSRPLAYRTGAAMSSAGVASSSEASCTET
jgi:hypothetical protein